MNERRHPPRHSQGHGRRPERKRSGGKRQKSAQRPGRLASTEVSLVYGVHALQALLTQDPARIQQLWLLAAADNPRLAELAALATAADVPLKYLPRADLDRLAPDTVHQGALAQCLPQPLASEAELALRWPSLGPAPLLLVLDGVMDPRNLGACLRSADAAGVAAVLLPRSRSAPLSAVARKTACGAAETLFIVEVANLARQLRWLQEQGVQIIGAAGEATHRFDQVSYLGPTALVLGGEARGLRSLTRQHCDTLVAIPMAAGAVSSLNLAVATGVLLFEAVRQRQT